MDTFVKKVAAGRNLTEEQVRDIAQGHFYSGEDGKEIGLVDEIGGLLTALAIAREKAGIEPHEKVNMIEIPKNKGFFQFGPFSAVENDAIRYIKMVSEHPGQPLPMMIPGSYPGKD